MTGIRSVERGICPNAVLCIVVEILSLKCIGITTWAFQGHMKP